VPSYFKVTDALIGVPSVRAPVLVVFTPPLIASLTVVRDLTGKTGNGPEVYFDFSTLSLVELPCSDGVISAESCDSGYCQDDERLTHEVSHVSVFPL
jgi:hypothetical protein